MQSHRRVNSLAALLKETCTQEVFMKPSSVVQAIWLGDLRSDTSTKWIRTSTSKVTSASNRRICWSATLRVITVHLCHT